MVESRILGDLKWTVCLKSVCDDRMQTMETSVPAKVPPPRQSDWEAISGLSWRGPLRWVWTVRLHWTAQNWCRYWTPMILIHTRSEHLQWCFCLSDARSCTSSSCGPLNLSGFFNIGTLVNRSLWAEALRLNSTIRNIQLDPNHTAFSCVPVSQIGT